MTLFRHAFLASALLRASHAQDCPAGECPHPTTGRCSPEFSCFANPCEVSDACGEGKVCTPNYCGGCNVVCTDEGGAVPEVLPAVPAIGDECAIVAGEDPDVCEKGAFCQLDAGVCNNKSGIHSGTCAEMGLMCIEIWMPVCGCDGTTYSNECKAHAAGVSVSREGECEAEAAAPEVLPAIGDKCTIIAGEDPNVCEEGAFCQLDTGVCNNKSAIHSGSCAAFGLMACPASWMPVCGCDGTTYSNECSAHAEGVSVSREGECDEAEGVGIDPLINIVDPEVPLPPEVEPVEEEDEGIACFDLWQPVCGTDGETYSNECYASVAGVDVASEGECAKDGEDAEMVVVDPPEEVAVACPFIYEPVCGDDGNTYGNSCEAEAAGVNVASEGECMKDGDDTEMAGVDPSEEESVVACTANWEPVCGDDGNTYGNSCEADAAGVAIAYEGECDEPEGGDEAVIDEATEPTEEFDTLDATETTETEPVEETATKPTEASDPVEETTTEPTEEADTPTTSDPTEDAEDPDPIESSANMSSGRFFSLCALSFSALHLAIVW